MSDIVIFSLFGNSAVVEKIIKPLKYSQGDLTIHSFPDNESLVKVRTDVKNKTVIFFACIDRPDSKIMQLIFAAEKVRSLGANKIYLIAPYLPYMRQDKEFHPGESVSSIYFAKLISHYFDYLITIDPHLHRWRSLSEIYSIPNQVLHAGNIIGQWIMKNIKKPVLVGPDSESIQWVREIAQQLAIPYFVLNKKRFGDHQVSIQAPDIMMYAEDHVVIIDDIISSGTTMIETVHHLKQQRMQNITCLCIHGIFADNAYQQLLDLEVNDVISCRTVVHTSNRIDLSELLILALDRIL